MRRVLMSAGLLIAVACAAAAEDRVRPTRIQVVPNFHAASVYAFFDGDANKNATVQMAYRAGDAKDWREGHPLSRTGPSKSFKGGRFAGSIFYLEPDEPLEVRVTFDDPDGLAAEAAPCLTARSRTRSDNFPSGSGKTYYVSPDGDDANPGTREKPFKTIQHAVDIVEPGDSIYLKDGTYRESVTIRKSGRPDAYILLRPDPEDTAPPMHISTTDGYGFLKHLRARAHMAGWVQAAGPWEELGNHLYALAEKRRVGTVTMTLPYPKGEYRPVGTRIYHHGSLDDLKKATVPLLPGWWQDEKAGRLYVRMDGDAVPKYPTACTVRLGVLPVGLEFNGASHWIVEGLEFEVFGGGRYPRGIEVRGGSDIVIRNCSFDTMRTGVSIRNRAERVLVERCTFRDTSIFDWPWNACKSHDVEGAAVSLAAGPGCVVRHNRIRGLFNGIAPATWGDLHNDAVNSDMDIHHNTFTELGDDPMEPEGSCMNVRFWHNETFNT
ncbi:MAG TPA: right-handed parallel beta-helix repeat-containing protein, partial [Phycisphaerae bacterium]|nr:right-handed parallel beta-helix repeat-containing protein [Phycisphaerae bacterium]